MVWDVFVGGCINGDPQLPYQRLQQPNLFLFYPRSLSFFIPFLFSTLFSYTFKYTQLLVCVLATHLDLLLQLFCWHSLFTPLDLLLMAPSPKPSLSTPAFPRNASTQPSPSNSTSTSLRPPRPRTMADRERRLQHSPLADDDEHLTPASLERLRSLERDYRSSRVSMCVIYVGVFVSGEPGEKGTSTRGGLLVV